MSKWINDNFTAFMLMVIFAIAALILAAVLRAKQYQCETTAGIMQVESQYSPVTGCMIEVDGKWMPLDAYYYNAGGDAHP